ncbi:MAG TPA: hypothetical protein H9677_04630 [Firmicutes bacterium]|nr:hypothetical protein [Bacillota bacterium]
MGEASRAPVWQNCDFAALYCKFSTLLKAATKRALYAVPKVKMLADTFDIPQAFLLYYLYVQI